MNFAALRTFFSILFFGKDYPEEEGPTIWRAYDKEVMSMSYWVWKGRSMHFCIHCRPQCRGMSPVFEAKCDVLHRYDIYSGVCDKCGARLTAYVRFDGSDMPSESENQQGLGESLCDLLFWRLLSLAYLLFTPRLSWQLALQKKLLEEKDQKGATEADISNYFPVLINVSEEENIIVVDGRKQVIEVMIICPKCGGLSNTVKIFLSEAEHLKAINNTSLAGKVRAFFYHCAEGLESVEDIIGGCRKCGDTLVTDVKLVRGETVVPN